MRHLSLVDQNRASPQSRGTVGITIAAAKPTHVSMKASALPIATKREKDSSATARIRSLAQCVSYGVPETARRSGIKDGGRVAGMSFLITTKTT